MSPCSFSLFGCALILTLASCHTLVSRRTETAVSEVSAAHRDTVRLTSLLRDTVRYRDTVRVNYLTRGETTYVYRDRVRTLYLTRIGTDTIYRTRIDTLYQMHQTAMATVKESFPIRRFIGIGLCTLLVFAIAVFALRSRPTPRSE